MVEILETLCDRFRRRLLQLEVEAGLDGEPTAEYEVASNRVFRTSSVK